MTIKVYFIMGSSSGIGEDVTKKLTAQNYKVIGCGFEETAPVKHDNFYYVQADITDWKTLGEKLGKMMRLHGLEQLDGVVTSAGLCGVAERHA